jgi:hypothetical protein
MTAPDCTAKASQQFDLDAHELGKPLEPKVTAVCQGCKNTRATSHHSSVSFLRAPNAHSTSLARRTLTSSGTEYIMWAQNRSGAEPEMTKLTETLDRVHRMTGNDSGQSRRCRSAATCLA